MQQQQISSINEKKLPPKLYDKGPYTIPCKIGTLKITKTLYDSGESQQLLLFNILMLKRMESGFGGIISTFQLSSYLFIPLILINPLIHLTLIECLS